VNELADERDFLLRSLDDLEREHDAGDVDDTDYATLRDDYTARAALVIRSIEAEQTGSEPPRTPRRWGRTVGWVAAIVVFGVLAGVLVARMSGSRRGSETATGDVRDNTLQLLNDARDAMGNQKFDEAIDLYDKALDLSPTNAEALAYRGWSRYQKGDDDAAANADVDAAIAADPTLPDAQVFKTIFLTEAGDFTSAAAQLKVFDALNPPSFMVQLVDQFALRERIVIGVLLADGAPTFTDAGFTADDLLAAARYSADGTSAPAPANAIQLLDLVLAADPNDANAHAYKGYTLARVGGQAEDQAVIDSGLAEIDAALAIDPQHAPALAYRALTRLFLYDDAAGAKVALDAYDALAEKPADITAIIDGTSLRDDIKAALEK